MLRIGGSIDVLDFEFLIDRIFVTHFHHAEHLSALGIYERDLFFGVDTSSGFGIDRDRDRDRPEHTACQFHVEARSAPVVMPHEAVQRRVGPHCQHEQIGDSARIERYFPQLFGALSLLAPLYLRRQQRLDVLPIMRRHELGHCECFLKIRRSEPNKHSPIAHRICA
jgi:hypothetical protein